MGHTSGIGKGFAIAALVVFGVVAVVSGLAYGLAAFFHNPYLFAVFTAASATGLCYLFYQTRGTCLKAGFSGLVGGTAGSFATAAVGGFLGVLAGVAVSIVVLFVVLFAILAFGPKSRPGSESWRKARAKK